MHLPKTSAYVPIHLSMYLPSCAFTHLYIYRSVYLSACLAISLTICRSSYLICPFAHLVVQRFFFFLYLCCANHVFNNCPSVLASFLPFLLYNIMSFFLPIVSFFLYFCLDCFIPSFFYSTLFLCLFFLYVFPPCSFYVFWTFLISFLSSFLCFPVLHAFFPSFLPSFLLVLV